MPERQYEVYPNVPTNHGPTWGFRCLGCAMAQDGYLKERYAHEEGVNHGAACRPENAEVPHVQWRPGPPTGNTIRLGAGPEKSGFESGFEPADSLSPDSKPAPEKERTVELLLAEIGRVHLFGWERNPRDESKDGQPRHVEGACRKCSLLRQDDAVRQQIWMLRDPKKAEHQLACQTHLNGGICTCGATQQSADLNDAQEGTP